MAYTYRISPEHDFAYVEAVGAVTGDDLLEGTRALFSDPAWRFGMRQINDYRRVTSLVLTMEDFQAVAALEAQVERERGGGDAQAPGRLALVTSDDLYEVAYQLYAMLSKTKPFEVRVFESLREAAQWIGLEASPEELLRGR